MKNSVMAITDQNSYHQIEIITEQNLTIKEAKKLLADLETEIEIIEWEEAKKKKANPDPEVSEKRVFAEKMGLQPSSVYNW